MAVEAMILRLAGASALFAQAADDQKAQPDLLTSLFGSPLLLFAMLFLVFYFIVMRPHKREQTQRKVMLAGV